MKRSSMILAALLPTVWLACLLVRSLACFDALATNQWYLYVIATLWAALQYTSIVLLDRYTSIRNVAFLCGAAHAAWLFVGLSVAGETALLTLSVVLDGAGVVLSLWLGIGRRIKNK